MEKRERIRMAHAFVVLRDIYSGGGLDNGVNQALPRRQPSTSWRRGCGMKQEMIDKLSAYDEMGVDRIVANVDFGCDPHETMDSIRYFAEEVMPHFMTDSTSSRLTRRQHFSRIMALPGRRRRTVHSAWRAIRPLQFLRRGHHGPCAAHSRRMARRWRVSCSCGSSSAAEVSHRHWACAAKPR